MRQPLFVMAALEAAIQPPRVRAANDSCEEYCRMAGSSPAMTEEAWSAHG